MSWSVSLSKTPASEVDAAIDALEWPEYAPESAEHSDQFAAAKAAAKAILASGALGTEGPFSVGIAGHANAGHVHPGGDNTQGVEDINVHVSQAR